MRKMMMMTGVIVLLTTIGCCSAAYSCNGQQVVQTDTVIPGGSTHLTDSSLMYRMATVFCTVYPAEIAYFNNPNAANTVYWDFDVNYSGVAYTSDAHMVFGVNYFNAHPADVDVVTHEAMHVVQAYGNGNPVPGWLTEGIADYARNRFGIYNQQAGWSLTPYANDQNYTDAYRITARFLLWLENNGHPSLTKNLDAVCRAGQYTADTWNQLAGASVDQLWSQYAANPNSNM